jgi:Family of unknown function (DUF6428)
MKISQFRTALENATALQFQLPTGHFVPAHFHITEAGMITKNFIDCGGVVRKENSISFQIWVAGDTDHRLTPSKLLGIIHKAEKLFSDEDLNVEVEYQSDTIGKYGLEMNENTFVLTATQTDCLAKDHCGIPPEKMKLSLSEIGKEKVEACCSPGGGCC